MGHAYPIREIARQAGVGEATVDRVLNQRPGVRSSTAARVHQAIVDLDRQRSQLRLNGRAFIVDVVMHTPDRFSSAVKAALEHELPGLQPASVRARFDFRERAKTADIVNALARIRHRGSSGVILKAADMPEIRHAIGLLIDHGIPVITLVTDIPMSRRIAYVGIDNRSAGATAAYLLHQWLQHQPGDILIALSRSAFRGEEDREIGFRTTMRAQDPSRALIETTDTDGLDVTVRASTIRTLDKHPDINAVYSIGGGNRAILDAFASVDRACQVFVGHDIDRDNRDLLQTHRISAVLHHDLRGDLRRACQVIMQAHGAMDGVALTVPSHIQVITPHNLPFD